MRRIINLLIIIITLSAFLNEIYSIPAFARKYNMSCKVCHSPFPKLKPYGEDFAANGFTLKDVAAPRYYVDAGDDYLTLIRDFPIALRIEGYLTYNRDKSEQTDFTGPSALKLLSGGTITNDVSYYVYYILEEGDIGKIEDAFLFFNDLFGSELDFSIGQFQVSDPVFKRELRLTIQDYLIYKVRPGLSNIDLTYDRGIMLSYGIPTNTDITLEIVNGSGIGPLFDNGNFDNDKYKNIFARISQEVMDQFRLGVLGYYGNEVISNTQELFQAKDEIWMAGADATIDVSPVELNVQYLLRNDTDPYALISGPEKVKTEGGFAELIVRPEGDNSKLYGVAVFNYIDSDENALDQKSAGVSLGYLLRRNIRLTGEYDYNFTNKFGSISVGFVSAF
jgi:hypothetical protein